MRPASRLSFVCALLFATTAGCIGGHPTAGNPEATGSASPSLLVRDALETAGATDWSRSVTVSQSVIVER
jgi:hypothetical protein